MSAAWRRARADLWPLLVTAVVVALTIGVTDAVPRLLVRQADAAVRAAVDDADPAADLVVTTRYGAGTSDRTAGARDTTAGVNDVARRLDETLPPSLRAVLGPPVASASGPDLQVSTRALPTGGLLRLAYLWAGQEPAVRWVQGGPPGSGGPDLTIPVGLSQAVAETLGAQAGDTLEARTADGGAVPVLVTGVYEAADPDDPAWTALPETLLPRTYGTSAPTTVVGGLLSAQSLPVARAALEPDGVTRTFRLPVEPRTLDHAASRDVLRQVAALEASPDQLLVPGPEVRVTSRLDLLLTEARQGVDATRSQAVVVLTGLAAGAGLVLLVAADLLARRRTAALRTLRARGTSLAGVARAAAAESAVVVGAAATVGLVLGGLAVPGPVTWPWVLAVVAVALAAPPASAAATARGADPRRAPTERQHRRLARRVRTVRRVSVEAALAVLAAAATVALRRRGVVTLSGPADLLLAAAPALVAATVALLLWRAVPPLLGTALRAARRSRTAGPLLALARARSASGLLPFVTLVVLTTLVTLCGALAATARAGQTDGSWEAVGADVVVRTDSPAAALQDVADTLSGAAGVDAVAVGRVQGRSQLFGVRGIDTVRVLAVDPGPYGALLARTPYGSPPALARLADPPSPAGAGPLPALVPAQLLGSSPSLRWAGVTIDLDPVGEAPDLPVPTTDDRDAAPVVVVDRATLDAVVAAAGTAPDASPAAAAPDTVWAVGPRAAVVAHDAAATAGADDLSRRQWLADRRADPLASGLLWLVLLAAVVGTALAATVVVLDAASSAPGRARALATARVLGLRGRDAARVGLGELLPPPLVSAAGGVVVGGLLVGALAGPLALRLVTGQDADPAVVLPPWVLVPLGVLAATVLAVVAVESSARRRERLGQVLRVR